MKKENMVKKIRVWRTFPHANSKRLAADCRFEEQEASEYATNVKFSRGSKKEIPSVYNDEVTSRMGNYPTKPKRASDNHATIRKMAAVSIGEMA